MRLPRLFRYQELTGEAGRQLFESSCGARGVVLSFRYPPLRSFGKEVQKDWGRVRVLVDGIERARVVGRSEPILLSEVEFPCMVLVESDMFRRKELGRVALSKTGLHLVEVTPPHTSGLPNTSGPVGVHVVDFRPSSCEGGGT